MFSGPPIVRSVPPRERVKLSLKLTSRLTAAEALRLLLLSVAALYVGFVVSALSWVGNILRPRRSSGTYYPIPTPATTTSAPATTNQGSTCTVANAI